MAVYLMTIIGKYYGSSSDIKPVNVSIGSTFYEYDTKIRYVTYDGINWVQYLN